LRVYVGWDSREEIAYEVCRHSLLRHASIPIDVIPLKQHELRAQGLYTRPVDPLASTEFTYTRFLVPHLAGTAGWALYCDCDFLWTADIAGLVTLTTKAAAQNLGALCVQHDYRPTETTKMDGRTQTSYPRKNWSSLILFNASHPQVRRLTPETVNRESGAYLHRFQWLDDAAIGAVPETWNWLEGWSAKPPSGAPNVVHYTRGGPWFDAWQDVDYADLWRAEAALIGSVTRPSATAATRS
jgi:hypothetical protein